MFQLPLVGYGRGVIPAAEEVKVSISPQGGEVVTPKSKGLIPPKRRVLVPLKGRRLVPSKEK